MRHPKFLETNPVGKKIDFYARCHIGAGVISHRRGADIC
jgi:hypothetical protein